MPEITETWVINAAALHHHYSPVMRQPIMLHFISIDIQMFSPVKYPGSMNSGHWYPHTPSHVPALSQSWGVPALHCDQWDMLHVLWSKSCCACVHQRTEQLAVNVMSMYGGDGNASKIIHCMTNQTIQEEQYGEFHCCWHSLTFSTNKCSDNIAACILLINS
jgi:hypothetical protein